VLRWTSILVVVELSEYDTAVLLSLGIFEAGRFTLADKGEDAEVLETREKEKMPK
jgi:hypothetical protein